MLNPSVAVDTLEEMHTLATRLRVLIATQPPLDLIGYIYCQRFMAQLRNTSEDKNAARDSFNDCLNETQFLLEYVHAVLSSMPEQSTKTLDEAVCKEIFEYAEKLKVAAMRHAMATSATSENNHFGTMTSGIEFETKSHWLCIRGHRYYVLEGEFYDFVLAPHDEIMRSTYGMGASEIATEFQNVADASRVGLAKAIGEIFEHSERACRLVDDQGTDFSTAMEKWAQDNPQSISSSVEAWDNFFMGGTCNLSRHTKLPELLLADLAYKRGEEQEFFAEGEYCGTPFRTLPARKKPLVQIGEEYYAPDPCFIRDSGYRTLLYNLLQRKPDYKKEFEQKQKIMSEAAFSKILERQLSGSLIHHEVYYKDPVLNQWVENDTLILLDDVLILVEAKSASTHTAVSPASNFKRHVDMVEELALKAYRQCQRFFNYLNSSDEVPIFRRESDRYVECRRLRISDYRLLLPIGLTVESFTPYSTTCKELPDITPLLGKYAFVSLSIDDLFVLNRFLPTAGAFFHYLDIRQTVAGIEGVRLYDEFDHLGAYIKNNRFDQFIREQQAKDNPTMIVLDQMCKVVDQYFEELDWEKCPVPRQKFPEELEKLLNALNATKTKGWIRVDNAIRDLGGKARDNLANGLQSLIPTLLQNPYRYLYISNESGLLFFWLQRAGSVFDEHRAKNKAAAAGLSANVTAITPVCITVDNTNGDFIAAHPFFADVPQERTIANSEIYDDAKRMKKGQLSVSSSLFNNRPIYSKPTRIKKIGRNELCPCCSGKKYKKCCGR